ncbi:hypothetical protein B0H16DRAFT_1450006 [Mycena metata]|uniref:Uncharacterized protein n=1 Tax=Mycena metata TaxID=1033252 RepID=A0AAD7K2A5_9AGAR|nr:hypothetical protein B0H16DRAFT_1450006 [Mycena metata]
MDARLNAPINVDIPSFFAGLNGDNDNETRTLVAPILRYLRRERSMKNTLGNHTMRMSLSTAHDEARQVINPPLGRRSGAQGTSSLTSEDRALHIHPASRIHPHPRLLPFATRTADARAIEARAEDGERAPYVRQRWEGEQGQLWQSERCNLRSKRKLIYIEVLVLIRSMVYWALPVRESSRGNWNGVGGNSLRHKTVIIDKHSKSNHSLVQQLDPTLHGTHNTIQQFRISPMQPLGSQVYHAAKLDFAQTL